mmetsp:Transcript_14083/g.43518  ORF Transcript_14083/g.43518 Transcript_14083/m.43518 type:complete len:185 (-) Transcript_14083:69-623(-)
MLSFAKVAVIAAVASAFVAPSTRLSAPARFTRPTLAAEPDVEVAATKEVAKLEDVEVSGLDDILITWGLKEDPRVPEDCRVDPMTRIKEAGKAGVAAYTLTEFAFWLGSVPLAIAAVAYTTGSLPDFGTTEGKEAIAGYVFVFINFARVIVPLRIALALALAPWCERNIIQKFFSAPSPDECDV